MNRKSLSTKVVIIVSAVMAVLGVALIVGSIILDRPSYSLSDLSGEWREKDNDSGTVLVADIENDTITINFVSDDTTSLYWSGSFVAPGPDAEEPYTWTSEADDMRGAMLASSSPTKDFTYEKGKLMFQASALGTTKNVTLYKQ